MKSLSNRCVNFVFFVVFSWTVIGTAIAATPLIALPKAIKPATENTTEEKTQAEPLRPVNTEGIDAAGKKVSASIEKISDLAAKYLGGWVKQHTMAGIPLIKLLFCLCLLLCVLVIERLLRWSIRRKIESIPYQQGVISWLRLSLKAIIKPVSIFIFVYGIYAALSPLYDHFEKADGTNLVLTVVKCCANIGGTVALFWFLYKLVILFDARLMKRASRTNNGIDNMLVPLIGKALRIFIVIVGVMMVIRNLTGMQIGPLLASLGIGGLAVALAAKDSIANFFGTLTILFDKPFQAGDRIVINKYDGSVENVGFRSTRIRLLNGHLVSIPNEKIVNSEVENVGRRPNIRWLTQIGIPFDTPPEKLQEAVQILRDILKDHEGIHPDFPPRVHFNNFKDWSLNITVVAWYHPPEWWDFQDWLQKTCFEILHRFDDAGIDFALPSRTLYLTNEDKRQLKLQLIKGDFEETNALKS